MYPARLNIRDAASSDDDCGHVARSRLASFRCGVLTRPFSARTRATLLNDTTTLNYEEPLKLKAK